MLLDTTYFDVQNSQESHKFKFSTSPVIFRILSDSLYSNKIGSIIRELASNAKDAHIAAGISDTPFFIELPVKNKLFNSTAPMFRITDYGTGLSEEDIYNIYTVYGESNKRHNNDMIGGFGIGSKSPFSYTETFTVISVYNGKRSVYCAYIDEKGFPSISKMSESETDKQPSVSVSFNVKPADIDEFYEEAVNQLRFFDPKPKLNIRLDFNEPKKLLEHDNWFISTDRYYSNEHYVRLLINGIPYMIDIKDFPCNERLTNTVLYVNIPIGVIDLNASRESIAYTEKTKSYLKDLISNIEKSVFNYINETNKDKSIYERSNFCCRNSISIPKNKPNFATSIKVPTYELDSCMESYGIKLYKFSHNVFKQFKSEFLSSYNYNDKQSYRTFPVTYKFYRISDKIPNTYLRDRGIVPNNSIVVKCNPLVDLSVLQNLFSGPEIESIDVPNYAPSLKATRAENSYQFRIYDRYTRLGQISDVNSYSCHIKHIDDIVKLVSNPNAIVFAMNGSELIYHPDVIKDNKFFSVMTALRNLSNRSKISGVYIISKTIIKRLKDTGRWEFPNYNEWISNIIKLMTDNVGLKITNDLDDICRVAKYQSDSIISNFLNNFNRIVSVGSDINDADLLAHENELIRTSAIYKKYYEFPEMSYVKAVHAEKIANIDISDVLNKIISEPLFMLISSPNGYYFNSNQCKYYYDACKKYNLI